MLWGGVVAFAWAGGPTVGQEGPPLLQPEPGQGNGPDPPHSGAALGTGVPRCSVTCTFSHSFTCPRPPQGCHSHLSAPHILSWAGGAQKCLPMDKPGARGATTAQCVLPVSSGPGWSPESHWRHPECVWGRDGAWPPQSPGSGPSSPGFLAHSLLVTPRCTPAPGSVGPSGCGPGPWDPHGSLPVSMQPSGEQGAACLQHPSPRTA